jgi:predicted AAA+ superfamily ATPase
MIRRDINLSKSRSFFLFGARGTGKSTLIREQFSTEMAKGSAVWFNLLDPELELRLRTHPRVALETALANKAKWVVIDEVQKIPSLLDIAHLGIEEHGLKFALTGSSARKLKRGNSNLLAGRASAFSLFPLSSFELGNDFDISRALNWGTLPGLLALSEDMERKRFLRSYAITYLKEEIQSEQIVREIDPFRRFLEVAAQCDGQIINAAAIGREASVNDKSVIRYFEILEDTLLGFRLDAYSKSVRKQQALKPKFYFFDLGVRRALEQTLDSTLLPSTAAYGKAFECFVVQEIFRQVAYREVDARLSYLRTKDDAEVDLIFERPGKSSFWIEIKSSTQVEPLVCTRLEKLSIAGPKEKRGRELRVFCRETTARKVNSVRIVPWQEGIAELFR